MIVFNNQWKLWQHEPLNTKWDLDSYNTLMSINNTNEFWSIYQLLNIECLKYNMLFFMKNDIVPLWEDDMNINGGALSIKVLYKDIYNCWMELSMALIGEYITQNYEDINKINGISISPKKGFCILKVWTNTNDKIEYNNSIPSLTFNNSIYKPYNTNQNIKM